MSKKLFVGSLEWSVTENDLQQAFSSFGEIEEVILVKDKFSGKSKGFGFVTFVNGDDADKATADLNNTDLKGRKIVVNEARPLKPREPRPF